MPTAHTSTDGCEALSAVNHADVHFHDFPQSENLDEILIWMLEIYIFHIRITFSASNANLDFFQNCTFLFDWVQICTFTISEESEKLDGTIFLKLKTESE